MEPNGKKQEATMFKNIKNEIASFADIHGEEELNKVQQSCTKQMQEKQMNRILVCVCVCFQNAIFMFWPDNSKERGTETKRDRVI